MAVWSRDQLLSARERAMEYNRGLEMGLWAVKESRNLCPEAVTFMIRAIEKEIKDNETRFTFMSLIVNRHSNLIHLGRQSGHNNDQSKAL